MRASGIYRTVVFAAASAGLWGQSLSIPASTVTHGASAVLRLTLNSPPGKAPVALQWELTIPPNVAVDVADITVGSAMESAQKALSCRLVERARDPGTVYACVLAGGQKPIPNGPVAAVRYRVPVEIRHIAEKVRVGKVVGSTLDLKKLDLEGAEATITVK
jgi:hypothetical protein